MKYTDLKPGMLTTRGLIIRAESPEPSGILGNNASILFFPLNDAFYGQCSSLIHVNHEFEILHEIGSDEYKKVTQEIINERNKYLSEAQSDIDLLRAYQMASKQ